MTMWRATVTLALAVSGARAQSSSGLGSCDPIDASTCMFPFPNDFWLRGPAQEVGTADVEWPPLRHLSFDGASLPLPFSNSTKAIDPSGWNELDGFSPVTSILTYFDDVDETQFAGWQNIADSVVGDAPSILFDTVTNTFLPHWIEFDHSSDVDFPKGYDRPLMLWPTKALENSRRYIVAFRGVKSTSGGLVEPSVAFKSLRDNLPSSDPNVNLRRDHFESDIFKPLSNKGVTTSSLTLAWDFTVGTTQSQTGRLVFMRDDAFTRMGKNPKFNITKIVDKQSQHTARLVQGNVFVPDYTSKAAPGAHLVIDDNGVPVYQRTTPVPFTVLIPYSAVNTTSPASLLQYGHGLFGSQAEVMSGYLDEEANEYNYVLGASNWIGLAEDDAIYVAIMLSQNISNFRMVPDRCTQGMVNALALMELMSSEAFLASDAMSTAAGGTVSIDPTKRFYDGNSQGGILGSVYMSASTAVQRGTLGVPGGPYSLLLLRSVDFAPLWQDLRNEFAAPFDRCFMFPFLQLLWDRLGPGGYMNHITANPLPGTPTKSVLIHYGMGDAQVTFLGAETLARSAGAQMYDSNVKQGGEHLYGFPFQSDSAVIKAQPGVAFAQGWTFNAPNVPVINIPANSKTDVHELPRKQPDAEKQMSIFFYQGEIVNTCPKGYCQGPNVTSSQS